MGDANTASVVVLLSAVSSVSTAGSCGRDSLADTSRLTNYDPGDTAGMTQRSDSPRLASQK